MIFSGAETESDIAPPVLEENKDDVVSATKTTKSLDGSALKTGQEEEGPEEADATEKAMEAVDNVVKSLDPEVESKEMQKQQPQDYNSISLRKVKPRTRNISLLQRKRRSPKGRGFLLRRWMRTPASATEQNKQAKFCVVGICHKRIESRSVLWL